MHKLFGTKILARQDTGRGHFYNQQVSKPDALKSIINKRYKRYGITPEIFEDSSYYSAKTAGSAHNLHDDLLLSGRV